MTTENQTKTPPLEPSTDVAPPSALSLAVQTAVILTPSLAAIDKAIATLEDERDSLLRLVTEVGANWSATPSDAQVLGTVALTNQFHGYQMKIAALKLWRQTTITATGVMSINERLTALRDS